MIYLDYAASSPVYEQAAEEMHTVMLESYGNPSALHTAGYGAQKILRQSRETMAQLLGVRESEVFFVSGATEANNWAIRSACAGGKGRNIVVFAAEHKSVIGASEAMCGQGYTVTRVYPDSSGLLPLHELESAITPDTCLVCVQAVNNETGVIQDIGAIADIVHKRGAALLCDAVQSFGHITQPLFKADYISISAHKFGGPKGIGCLVVRQPEAAKPMLFGGGQEYGLRSGTENIPAIAAMALAAQLSAQTLEEERSRLMHLGDSFVAALREIDPEIAVNAADAPRSGSILSIRFPDIPSEEMVALLDLEGICASAGSACTVRNSATSHTLMAMGLSEQHARESVRFSFGRLTTQQEIEETVAAIGRILKIRKG